MIAAGANEPDASLGTPSAALDVLAAVPAWWARRARLAGLHQAWRDWRLALPAPPVDLPPRSSFDSSHHSSHSLGESYACALAPAVRIQHGRHYTPKPLADALWMEVDRAELAAREGRIVDPAAGAGGLLIRPLRQFTAIRRDADPRAAIAEAAETFAGTDNDALAAWLGSAILAAELLPLWTRLPERERRPLPVLINEGDGLCFAREHARIVVMNPPYGRAALDDRERIRWQESLYGHANWYGVFLHAAVERALPGGLIAAVLPASFLGGAYYQRLRRFLAEHAPLVRLRRIDDRAGVFASGVLQETCLAVFQKGATQHSVACSTQAVNGRMRSLHLGRAVVARDAPELPWLLPRSRSDRALVRAAAMYPSRLPDYGWKASTGPLVWNRHKPRIHPEPTRGAVPILWAADIETSAVRRSPSRNAQRWIDSRERDEFMRLTEPAILVQRTTAPEQPRRLVAAMLTADALRDDWGGVVVVENHVNVLRAAGDGPLSLELLSAILNSATIDRLYRCMTGTVAVSAYELEALPLPGADLLAEWSLLDSRRLACAIAGAFA